MFVTFKWFVHPFTGSVDNRWNSTSWDEFARKWNKPVHTFLLRHVYASSISAYRLSKKSAMTFTFILSAAVHELVMAVVTKKIRLVARTIQSTSQLTHIPCGTARMYLFALQVCCVRDQGHVSLDSMTDDKLGYHYQFSMFTSWLCERHGVLRMHAPRLAAICIASER